MLQIRFKFASNPLECWQRNTRVLHHASCAMSTTHGLLLEKGGGRATSDLLAPDSLRMSKCKKYQSLMHAHKRRREGKIRMNFLVSDQYTHVRMHFWIQGCNDATPASDAIMADVDKVWASAVDGFIFLSNGGTYS